MCKMMDEVRKRENKNTLKKNREIYCIIGFILLTVMLLALI